MPIYLTGYINDHTDRAKHDNACILPLGMIVQPKTARMHKDAVTGRMRESYLLKAGLYDWVGIDNGCFSEIGRRLFSLDDYFRIVHEAHDRSGDNVIFVTAPDVVCDWKETLRQSLPILPKIRKIDGFTPAAIVIQNGATPETVPWDEIDCVFVGGDDAWKEGPEARDICHETRRRGMWVHMGRVNGMRRMRVAWDFKCDSVDGTYLLHECQDGREYEGAQDIIGWLRVLYVERRRKNRAWLMEVTGHDEAWVNEFMGEFYRERA